VSEDTDTRSSERVKSIAEKIVVPAAAAVASAAAGYLGRRAPKLVEERLWPAIESKVLPWLRNAGSPRDLAQDVTDQAKQAAGKVDRERERAERASRRNERRRATSS